MFIAFTLLVLTADTPIATIGAIRLSREEVFALSDGFAVEPEADHLERGRACLRIEHSLRLACEKEVLRRAGLLPPESELRVAIERLTPSREEISRANEGVGERIRALQGALLESESDPSRDYEIWKARVSKWMSFEAWVQFRTEARGRQFAPPPSALVSEREMSGLRSWVRDLLIEERFQGWLCSVAAAREGVEPTSVPWSMELQDAFWGRYLAENKVWIDPQWKCLVASPERFRAPRADAVLEALRKGRIEVSR